MKKLYTIVPVMLVGLLLAGCGTTNPTPEDSTPTPVEQTQEDTTASTAPAQDIAQVCETYLEAVQCMADAYPEMMEEDEDFDLENLREEIYSAEMSDQERQVACAFALGVVKTGMKEGLEDSEVEADRCGILELEIPDVGLEDYFKSLYGEEFSMEGFPTPEGN